MYQLYQSDSTTSGVTASGEERLLSLARRSASLKSCTSCTSEPQVTSGHLYKHSNYLYICQGAFHIAPSAVDLLPYCLYSNVCRTNKKEAYSQFLMQVEEGMRVSRRRTTGSTLYHTAGFSSLLYIMARSHHVPEQCCLALI